MDFIHIQSLLDPAINYTTLQNNSFQKLCLRSIVTADLKRM